MSNVEVMEGMAYVNDRLAYPCAEKLPECDPDYAPLLDVLLDVFCQTAKPGEKGKRRHATGDRGFRDQPIFTIAKAEGFGYLRGQALKKLDEAPHLDTADATYREVIGAICYLAYYALLLKESQHGQGNPPR